MKKIFLVASLAFAINANAQVPSYVPTNGLQGWWPFYGNANDQSGNGYNGTISGSTLTIDRFGNSNKAYSFDGTNDTIKTTYVQTNITALSISAWFKTTIGGPIVAGDQNSHCITLAVGKQPYDGINTGKITFRADGPAIAIGQITDSTYLDNNWHNVVGVYSGSAGLINDGQFQIYVDNVLASSTAMATGGLTAPLNDSLPTIFGSHYNWSTAVFNGLIDDIGIWNRALTPQEISDLYNANICYQYVTVTDTLLINTTITDFNPITYKNTIKVWPNPTHDHITIDNGNIANLTGYQIKITNSLSQQVFQSNITQQQFYVDLTTWTGNGIYFVHIIDGQGHIIDIKKIILQ